MLRTVLSLNTPKVRDFGINQLIRRASEMSIIPDRITCMYDNEHKKAVDVFAKSVNPQTQMQLLFIDDDQSWEMSTESKNFSFPRFFKFLKTKSLGRCLLYSKYATSTQSMLQGSLSEAPIGTVYTCFQQIQGKGRGDNTWTSPAGCLMFSFKTETQIPSKLPFIQYLVSLALIRAIRTHHPGSQNVNAFIKWPNDIYAPKPSTEQTIETSYVQHHSGKSMVKIGGILCNSVAKNGKYTIVVGVGLNISNSQPTTCLNDLCTFDAKTDKYLPDSLLAGFLSIYEEYALKFEQQGFEPFVKDYLAAWLHTDQPVEVKFPKGIKAPDSVITSLQVSDDENDMVTAMLIIKGITANGYLRGVEASKTTISASSHKYTEIPGGRVFELHPDSNSLDWMKGLMVHKIIK